MGALPERRMLASALEAMIVCRGPVAVLLRRIVWTDGGKVLASGRGLRVGILRNEATWFGRLMVRRVCGGMRGSGPHYSKVNYRCES